jgi:hypothetical protein
MATPHVAGTWALLKQLLPTGTVSDLLNALRTSGVPLLSSCDNRQQPIPRIQVDRAVPTLVGYVLTIGSSSFGTTNPGPGAYHYGAGTQAQVAAVPAAYSTFVNWSSGASGTTNPLLVLMDQDKSIFANFRYVSAPAATGRKVVNRSYSQAEYINVLSWQPNSANQGLDITGYRVYRLDGGTRTKLAEVQATGSTFEYVHRNVGRYSTIQYAIVAVTRGDFEGYPATITVQ